MSDTGLSFKPIAYFTSCWPSIQEKGVHFILESLYEICKCKIFIEILFFTIFRYSELAIFSAIPFVF